MSLDYSGFEKLLVSVKELQKDHEAFIRSFLLEMGMRIIAQTKKLTPVDTGVLRETWELSDVFRKGDDLFIVITNPTEYASFIEDGHMQSKRFLPIHYLEESKANTPYLNYLYEVYGDDIQGVMLHEKFIPGKHMAKISINKVNAEIPKRYQKAFDAFLVKQGLAD